MLLHPTVMKSESSGELGTSAKFGPRSRKRGSQLRRQHAVVDTATHHYGESSVLVLVGLNVVAFAVVMTASSAAKLNRGSRNHALIVLGADEEVGCRNRRRRRSSGSSSRWWCGSSSCRSSSSGSSM